MSIGSTVSLSAGSVTVTTSPACRRSMVLSVSPPRVMPPSMRFSELNARAEIPAQPRRK